MDLSIAAKFHPKDLISFLVPKGSHMASMFTCNYLNCIPKAPSLDHLSGWNASRNLVSVQAASSKPKVMLKCSSVSSLSMDSREDQFVKEGEEQSPLQGMALETETDTLVKEEAERPLQDKIVEAVEHQFAKEAEAERTVQDVSSESREEKKKQKPLQDRIVEAIQHQFVKEGEAEKRAQDASFESAEDEVLTKEEDLRPLNEMWKEIQGCDDWEGLLDPMNHTLRQEIIRYGDFAQACYDAFDFDPFSKYCGSSKYEVPQFFEKLGMADQGYQVSRYLYATSNINLPNFFQHSKLSSVWSRHANWMGYVAVATDKEEIKRLGRRDILVAWRGTVTYLEWIHDLKDILHPANFCDDPHIKIESGFFDLYTVKEQSCNYATYSAREQILAEIRRLVERYGNEELSITITGHSLGAALALLSAYDMSEMRLNIKHDGENGRIPITVYSFSGPRVGNLKFKDRCDELGIKVLRVINEHDKVPKVPGLLANEKHKHQKYIEEVISFPWSYAHVGVELALNHTMSPFLRQTKDMTCLHNLEALLHLVDGFHGKNKPFKLAVKRDIALVNKCCGFLKDEYEVPPHWRQDENKGMIRTEDGRWVLPERTRMEAHPPDTDYLLQQVLKIRQLSSSKSPDIASQAPNFPSQAV